jgi:hypothetical protein
MKSTYAICLLLPCVGCTCSSPRTPVSNNSAIVAHPDRADEKLQAFEIIATEFKSLPAPKRLYASMPKHEEEELHRQILEGLARIEGMLRVFSVISFDPETHPEIAKKIVAIYEKSIDADEYRCPDYLVIITKITDTVLPILKATWPHGDAPRR